MRRLSVLMITIALCALLTGAAADSQQQITAVDTLSAFAGRTMDDYCGRLELNEKLYVDDHLARLAAPSPTVTPGETSSAAVMASGTASSQYIPIVLASAAAR